MSSLNHIIIFQIKKELMANKVKTQTGQIINLEDNLNKLIVSKTCSYNCSIYAALFNKKL